MVDISLDGALPKAFSEAVESLRTAKDRTELALVQIPAPGNLASQAIAFAASAETANENGELELSSGRFVLLYEPNIQTEWAGNFRIVCFAKSPIEIDIADDHLVSDVTWGWLTSSLKTRGAKFHNAAGTATRVISSGYGSLQDQTNHAELELRASWSPDADSFNAHLEAWQDLVCLMAGHLEVPADVTHLTGKR